MSNPRVSWDGNTNRAPEGKKGMRGSGLISAGNISCCFPMNSDMVPKWKMNAFQSKHRQSNIKYLISRGKGWCPRAQGKLMDLKLDKQILSSKYPCRIHRKLSFIRGKKKKNKKKKRKKRFFAKKFYPCADIWGYMKLTNMKTSPNSLLAQSSFSLPNQGKSMVSTKLTVVTSAPAGVLCQCLSFQIGAKLL